MADVESSLRNPRRRNYCFRNPFPHSGAEAEA